MGAKYYSPKLPRPSFLASKLARRKFPLELRASPPDGMRIGAPEAPCEENPGEDGKVLVEFGWVRGSVVGVVSFS